MKSLLKLFITGVFACMLIACGSKNSTNTVKVGVIAGPEMDLMEVAKDVAARKFHLNIKIVSFSDYSMPNTALNDGSINANMFQHQPYLDESNEAHGYHLVAIAKTFIYPMAIYSKSVSNISKTPKKAMVAIPNDPSNGARALLLLQKAHLIKLKNGGTSKSSKLDIVSNPKQLNIKELDAAQLPRILADVDLAVINTNYAIPAGLLPTRDALMTEGVDSLYANIIVVREQDKDNEHLQQLVTAFQSPEVIAKADHLFAKQAIKAW